MEQINSHFSGLGTSSKHMLPAGMFEFVLIDIHCRFSLHFSRIIADSVTVLCKSNASEMREFHSLFP